jgi:hypothetical protein
MSMRRHDSPHPKNSLRFDEFFDLPSGEMSRYVDALGFAA